MTSGNSTNSADPSTDTTSTTEQPGAATESSAMGTQLTDAEISTLDRRELLGWDEV